MEKIIVLDFGSQYNQLIVKKIRQLGVLAELIPHHASMETIRALNPMGIIFSGGPDSVYSDDAFMVDAAILSLNIPILGICYGMQLMAKLLGGDVERASHREYGQAEITIDAGQTLLFQRKPETQTVWMSHGDQVTRVPADFKVTASSATCPVVAFENNARKFYGVQFHPEVDHTRFGMDLLKQFVFTICGCTEQQVIDNFIDQQIAMIQKTVGHKKVLLGLSGGVDSSVAGVLIQKAIGAQLVCIFVDHGFLRKNEVEEVRALLGTDFGLNIIYVDARDRFMEKLHGVTDPEVKRKLIGNEFIQVFDDEAKKLNGIEFLAQGTLYTDIIESGTETAQTIKSHHNVGGLPKHMQFTLLEPLKTLFKDEVRQLGIKLGMPASVVWRQPFPGPGLAVRILGAVTEEKLGIVRDSDAILREEIMAAALDREIWQYFTVLPDIRSVGVMGDGRTYEHTVGIRAVTSEDGMTADFARIPWAVLQKISSRIVNEVTGVNRVVYDITSKPPATVEWE